MRRHAHRPATIVLLALIAGTATMTDLPRADAASTSTTLCRGFVQCVERGYGHHGYRTARSTSHWNMTPGVSCTNYVAYRLTHGRLAARPPGTGAARTWAPAARAQGVPVVTRPRPGDVAWWDADAGLSGRQGHVAVVEQVRRDGSVVVSEDNMDAAFGYRLVRPGVHFPTRFVRYPHSDGSPSGALVSLTPLPGQLSVLVAASEPDRPGQAVSYLVTLGAPRTGVPAESFTFRSSFFLSSWTRTLRTRGEVDVWVYALNEPGTGGADTLLGQGTVTLR